MIFQKSPGRVQNSPYIRPFRPYSARYVVYFRWCWSFSRFRGGLFLAGGPKSTSSGRALTKVDTENSECGCPHCRTSSSTAPLWDRICTDLNSLCYNSVSGQGQLLWVGVCLHNSFGRRFSLVSMVSINLGIWFYQVEMGDAGETIEPEESQ
jgi:hypothetical protein